MKQVIKKYNELARLINKDLKVRKTATDWYCTPSTREVYVPQVVTEAGEKEFLASIEKLLPKDKKNLINDIPDFMWSFLHELGHCEKGWTEKDDLVRWFINLCGKLGFSSIANKTYFNLVEEKTASKWAVNYVCNNTKLVAQYSCKIIKKYQEYYKRIGVTED